MALQTDIRSPAGDSREGWFGLSWRRLVVIGGSAASLAATVVSLYLTDVEGGLVTVVYILSTVLFASGRRRTGVGGLIAVSALTYFFMTAAALVNFRSGGLESLIISVGLSTLSGLVLASGIGWLVRRDRPATFGPWLIVGVLALSLVQGIGAFGRQELAEGAEAGVRLTAENLAFSEADLTVSAGEVSVGMENRDLFWHTFTIDELGVDLRVPVGADMSVTFDAPAGRYVFICAIPGHPEAGMRGILTVVEG